MNNESPNSELPQDNGFGKALAYYLLTKALDIQEQEQEQEKEKETSFSQRDVEIDILNEEHYKKLLGRPCHPKQQIIHYYRFQLYLVLAHHTGLRAGDIGRLTKEKLGELLTYGQGRFDVTEKKTSTSRHVVLSEKAVQELRDLSKALDVVYSKENMLMGTPHSRNWTRFIKTTLGRYTSDLLRSDQFESNQAKG